MPLGRTRNLEQVPKFLVVVDAGVYLSLANPAGTEESCVAVPMAEAATRRLRVTDDVVGSCMRVAANTLAGGQDQVGWRLAGWLAGDRSWRKAGYDVRYEYSGTFHPKEGRNTMRPSRSAPAHVECRATAPVSCLIQEKRRQETQTQALGCVVVDAVVSVVVEDEDKCN
ncbi:hypothetical protein LX36DRAFT_704847 [Colletotrichum falcatum]|nr:hypothetical protein LX36DRAFT_704847 [Colletotrichum falcatum]